MSLTQFHKYNSNTVSFDLSYALRGILKSGRYSGFDVLSPVSGLEFNITHAPSDQITNSLGGSTFDYGVYITKTGQVYRTDDTVNITLDPEIASFPRYDALVAKVTYAQNPAGNTPTYTIKKGVNRDNFDNGNFTAGILSDEVVIGIFKLEANAVDDTKVTWVPNWMTAINGASRMSEFYPPLFEPLVAGSVNTAHSGFIDIGDTVITDIGGQDGFAILPEYNGKIIRIKGYTGGDGFINARYGNAIKAPFKCSFLWDEKQIRLFDSGGSLITLLIEATKLPYNRAQYTIMDLRYLEGGTNPLDVIVSGELA